MAAISAACSAGSGESPKDDANSWDPPHSSFESGGISGVDQASCAPCGQKYRCNGTILGTTLSSDDEVELGCGTTVSLTSGDVQANDQQVLVFRCGGAVETGDPPRRVGNWTKSGDGVLGLCLGVLGSDNCLTCAPTGASSSDVVPVQAAGGSSVDAG